MDAKQPMIPKPDLEHMLKSIELITRSSEHFAYMTEDCSRKTCLTHLKIDKTKVLKKNGSIMKVKGIAEWSFAKVLKTNGSIIKVKNIA